MIKYYNLYYETEGCSTDLREFRTLSEIEEWLPRQLLISPETTITSIVPVY